MGISQKWLMEWLRYDPFNGDFIWLKKAGRNMPGTFAGTLRSDGYLRIQIDGIRKYASHWAWLYMTGELPENEIDHIDRNRANNAWANLRAATKSQNCANRPKRVRESDLPRGVTRRGRKFVSQIRVRGESIYLGIYDTPYEAHDAYAEAALKEFGEFSVLHPQ